MSDIKELQNMAGSLYNNVDMKNWLFAHTRSQEEYEQVRRALKILSGFQPVEWIGKAGSRKPVEI